jgi:methylamine utilization protein MauJ
VTFVLSRPGFPLQPENLISSADLLKGDSHLAIAAPAYVRPDGQEADRLVIGGNSPDGTFHFIGLPNEKGFLGKIESDPFAANTFNEADQKAFRALVPSLSYWSAELDIPLSVYQVESTEITTGNKQTGIIPPYPNVPWIGLPVAQLEPEFLGCASLYREALITNSLPYRYLCLYKVIEGILGRRARLAAEARRAGREPRRFVLEDVPGERDKFVAWLNSIFSVRMEWNDMIFTGIFVPDALGKSFGYVIEKFLRPLRVKVAHALSESSGELTMSADELLHIRELSRWLPLTKCIVRRLMKNEFPSQFLRYLADDGTIRS